MAIELVWWEEPLLEYSCMGPVDGPALVAANEEALADPRFPRLRAQLCSMGSVTSFDIERPEIERIVRIDLEAARRAPGLTKVAIACRQDLIYGFARMYEMILDGAEPGWETRVFRTRAEALAWIDLGGGSPG